MINALDIESSVLTLWDEFLKTYFDGSAHALGAHAPATFPKAALRYQQAALPQPMDGLTISVVWVNGSGQQQRWEEVNGSIQQTVDAATQFLFFVRASGVQGVSGPAAASANAKKYALTAASLLYALLANGNAVRGLAAKGIHKIRPGTPQLVADDKYAVRMLSVRARLRYPILPFVTDPNLPALPA